MWASQSRLGIKLVGRKPDFLRVQAIMKVKNVSLFCFFAGASAGQTCFLYFMIKYTVVVKSKYLELDPWVTFQTLPCS